MKKAAAAAVLAALASCSGAERAAEVPVVRVGLQGFARIIEAEGHLRPVRATPVTVPSDVEWPLRITWLAVDGGVVKQGDPVARFDDLELQQRLADGEADLAVATAKRQKEAVLQRAAGQDRQRATRSSQRDLDLTQKFQRRDTAIFSRDQIIEWEIDERLQRAKVDSARDSEQADQRLGRNKLGLIDVEAKKAKERISRSRQGLHALQISAPHDGVFTLRRNWSGEPMRVGDTAFRSMSVAEVSLMEKMEVEVFVLEAEAAGLSEGRKAEVVIDARPGRPFPAVIQQVETVAKRRQSKSPTQYFGVILRLEQTLPEVMKPGQRVRARLHLHEERALVVPRPALFDSNGRWVVYRRGAGGAFAAVPVKLGASTGGLVAIESGLAEGDVIALRDPDKAAGELVPGPAQGAGAQR